MRSPSALLVSSASNDNSSPARSSLESPTANAHLRAHPMPGCPPRVGNVVFMGMGEPLANYDNVRESIRRMIN